MENKDAGFYVCEADNGVPPSLSSVVKLLVHNKPHFKSNFQVIRVQKDETLRIPCLVFGDKPIKVQFKKDNSDIDLNSDTK